jgi:hypothetical protein
MIDYKEAKYRIRHEVKCCWNCKHLTFYYDDSSTCDVVKIPHWYPIDYLGICDKYESDDNN